MGENAVLTTRFEEHRPRLRAVAYQMLGSVSEADDAVREALLRTDGADAVENLGGWLTTLVAQVCLNVLRSREQRRDAPFDARVPDPLISREDGNHPEHEADSVGLALLVVLDTLEPAERLAFVLHDLFAVPFDEIAPLIEHTADATRQLAGHARHRVEGQAPAPDPDLSRQRAVVDAFFAAARDSDFEALVTVLDPDVVLRSDGGVALARHTVVLNGARIVASRAVGFGRLSPYARPALINGAAGVVVVANERPVSVMGFTVIEGRIVAIHVIADPDRLGELDLSVLEG